MRVSDSLLYYFEVAKYATRSRYIIGTRNFCYKEYLSPRSTSKCYTPIDSNILASGAL